MARDLFLDALAIAPAGAKRNIRDNFHDYVSENERLKADQRAELQRQIEEARAERDRLLATRAAPVVRSPIVPMPPRYPAPPAPPAPPPPAVAVPHNPPPPSAGRPSWADDIDRMVRELVAAGDVVFDVELDAYRRPHCRRFKFNQG